MGAASGTVLTVMAVAGMAMQAYGQYQEGQDAKKASEYNASISRQEAELARQSGALDAERQRKQTGKIVGTQKTQYGASGVELTGSPLDVMIETAAEGELDARIIEYNANVLAAKGMSQAAYDEKLAGIYERSGMMKAGSTLLTQGSKISSDYIGYGYKKPETRSQTKGY